VDSENATAACAADILAAFAAQLTFDDLPADAVLNAKLCLIDAVACAVFGAARIP
jgi:2-methylcitrate dehydratase PrpD